MKKSNIIVNHDSETLTISKAFHKRASVYGTPEYHELRACVAENKGYEIVFKSANKKSYKNLTLDVMEDYIKTQANSEQRMKEFEAVKKIGEIKKSLYPTAKKWFLETYTYFKSSDALVEEIEALVKAANETLPSIAPVAKAG